MANLPPLALLQTIESVVQFKSFKRAAEAMNVTPSAVSHRVRLLEEQLGRQLFIREGKGIKPTENAEKLAAILKEAQANIRKVWMDVATDAETKTVRVSCMAAFAEQFILSNLNDFKRKFPHFQVDSTNTTYAEGGAQSGYDIMIGIGPPPDDNWQCEKLHQLMVKPVLAKQIFDHAVRDGSIYGPLLETTVTVAEWESAIKTLPLKIHTSAKIIKFDSIVTMCSAAEHGVGIALAPSWIADKMIKSGKVVALADDNFQTEFTYWYASRKDERLASVHDRFFRWLCSKVSQSGHERIDNDFFRRQI